MSGEAPSPGRSVGPRHQSRFNVTQDALNDLAGTGTARHRHFVSLVDAYHREWRAFFVPLIFQKARVTAHDSIPLFRYQEERFGDVVTRASISLVALLAPTAILAALGFRRLRYFSISSGNGRRIRAKGRRVNSRWCIRCGSEIGTRDSGLAGSVAPNLHSAIGSLQFRPPSPDPRAPSPEPIEVTARWVRRRLRAPRDDSADGLRQCR
jgi:Domain of unknown function (DUF3526)